MKDEDKTFENERKHMNEPVKDRGTVDPILAVSYTHLTLPTTPYV